MTHKQHYDVYIASCTGDGGIYHYRLYQDNKIEFASKITMDNPTYMIKHKNKMHVILSSPFKNTEESGYICLSIGEDGSLTNQDQVVSTKGIATCHLAFDGSDVFCANYLSGSVTKLPDKIALHSRKSIHPIRQTSPHVHQILFTPDDDYICAVDLGIDQIILYDRQLQKVSTAEVPSGHGARHMVFTPDGAYAFCANELIPTVTAYSYTHGVLKLLKSYPLLNEECESYAAAIRVSKDGKRLYVSNRGHNSISCFSVENGELTLIKIVASGGNWPRDFVLTPDERLLICTNERSSNVAFFIMEDTIPSPIGLNLEIKNPLCVVTVKK